MKSVEYLSLWHNDTREGERSEKKIQQHIADDSCQFTTEVNDT